MKAFLFCLLCQAAYVGILLAQSGVNVNGAVANPAASIDLSRYELLFSDDFEEPTLNTKYWTVRHENEIRNGAITTAGNISVENHLLRLKDGQEASGRYTAAEISTEQHPELWTRYGYFEIRARLSSGVGTSCAFWLQSPKINIVSQPPNAADNGVEIDVFENGISRGINKLFYSLHWNGYDPKYARSLTQTDVIPGIYQGFHVFGFEWTAQQYRVFIDGHLRAVTDSMISRTPEFLILGNGRGGYGGDAAPFPNPDFFDVDYFKAYRRVPEVVLFKEKSFLGKASPGMLVGRYTRDQLNEMMIERQCPGSADIPDGWQVIIYDEDLFRGNSWRLSGRNRTLQPPFATINSIEITRQ